MERRFRPKKRTTWVKEDPRPVHPVQREYSFEEDLDPRSYNNLKEVNR